MVYFEPKSIFTERRRFYHELSAIRDIVKVERSIDKIYAVVSDMLDIEEAMYNEASYEHQLLLEADYYTSKP